MTIFLINGHNIMQGTGYDKSTFKLFAMNKKYTSPTKKTKIVGIILLMKINIVYYILALTWRKLALRIPNQQRHLYPVCSL